MVLYLWKTGTAENYAKIGGKKMENHSIFVAFAPMENQKIAACD
jgi:penicillin-binding protein 2